jgi:CRP-like cAMP-binding protein
VRVAWALGYGLPVHDPERLKLFGVKNTQTLLCLSFTFVLACELYLDSCMQMRTFHARDWIVSAGERACRRVEAYFITSGEAEVLLPTPGTAGVHTRLCMRRAGNFIGAILQHYGGSDSLHHSPPLPSSPANGTAKKHSAPVPLPAPWQASTAVVPVATSLSSMSLASSSPLPWSIDAWPVRDTARGSAGESSTSIALRTILMVLRVARFWIGHRRTVSVRAVSEVTAVELSHEDMKWAVAHDYRMSNELTRVLRQRKLLVVKAMRAEKRAIKERQSGECQE